MCAISGLLIYLIGTFLCRYLKAASIGEDIIISASTQKCGKNLAFLDVLITKKKGGDIIAKGSHTKFVGAETVLQKINTWCLHNI